MTASDDGRPGGGNLERYTSRGHALARFIAQHLVLKPVVWSLVTVNVIGVQNLKDVGKAFVVIANHGSHLDTPLILGALPRKMSRYLAAGAAADYFFDVWWRRGLTALFFNAFPVDRTGTHPRRVSAKELLKSGVPLLVFPEGTRTKDGTLGAFKPGAAGLAIAAGVPAVPIALIGAREAHPRGSNWPKAGRLPVGVVFGKPMSARSGETAAEFMQRIKDEIVALLAEHAARILDPAEDPKPGSEGDSK